MNKDNNHLVKSPSTLMYGIFRIISKLISKFVFNLKITKNDIKNIKGPYIIIANHESFIDFINLVCCSKEKMTFVVSSSFYNSMRIHHLIKLCAPIPKQQFQTSITDLKKMKYVIDNNRPLAIYPAGLMSDNGITTPIPKGSGKLVKWLNCDIYIAKTEGSYLTYPKWAKKAPRKGKITLSISKLISKTDLANYSNDEINQIIFDSIYYNAYDNQEKNMVEYKNGDNIEGLNNVLYKCLKCNKEFTHKIINKNIMECTYCNNKVKADKYGFLNKVDENTIYYKKVSDWSNHIYNQLFEQINSNECYSIEDEAKVEMINYKKHQFEYVGDCHISLSREGFKLKGIINNDKFDKSISAKEFIVLPFSPGKHFEIQDNKTIYRILPKNSASVSKWMLVLKCLYQINHKKIKEA